MPDVDSDDEKPKHNIAAPFDLVTDVKNALAKHGFITRVEKVQQVTEHQAINRIENPLKSSSFLEKVKFKMNCPGCNQFITKKSHWSDIGHLCLDCYEKRKIRQMKANGTHVLMNG